MPHKLDEAKSDLLARAAEVGDRTRAGRSGGGDDTRFLQLYYRHVAPEDVIDRDPVDVYGAAMSHRRLAAHRPQGCANVRVFSPTIEEHGWSAGHTVVEIVTDDMPFLVDSVNAELTRLGRAIHLVVHPQLVVRRSITGELVEILDVPPHEAPADATAEAWLHVEVDRESDCVRLDEMARSLQRVLRDVREAVEDWAKMRAAARRIADELERHPPRGPREQEVAEAQELLRWLADEHFTFLGYR